MKIILLGAPGSGKGSLAKKLLTSYNLAHISTGDLFRAAINKDDDFAKEIKSIIASGQYVPDSITNKIAADAILEASNHYDGFILDGYPRTIDQANYLKEVSGIDSVLYLDIDNSELIKRITGRRLCSQCGAIYNVNTSPKPANASVCDQCGGALIQRKDDNEEVAHKRIQVYMDQTKPLIDFYEAEGLLHTVNAAQDLDSLFNDVEKIISSKN
ncbi:adenylate kinase [Ureaplasma ceti]|uniref:Adenylate kinase n=1 Tax=Ureaplasma ceti TaxID=3119530 RepID=A0ABP9U6A2_9BACT